MSASVVLDRLSRVKQTKPGAWMAACPCCESRKGRPLAISEANDGRVLMHAFCGCSTESVLARVGLTVTDLFHDKLSRSEAQPRSHAKVPASEVLNALSNEVTTLALIASDVLAHKEISEQDWQRLAVAVNRITNARDYVNERIR